MKLTEFEKKLIQERREKAANAAAELKARQKAVAEFIDVLSDAQTIDLAKQILAEHKRVTSNPGHCTCDSQWTNPKCPRVVAGWRGMDCNIPPLPVLTLRVSLK